MHIKLSVCFSIVFLLSGCHTSYHSLSAGGKRIRVVDTKLDSRCLFLGEIEGAQSNWMSEQPYDKKRAIESAATDLRNKASMMGGNVITDVTDVTDPLFNHILPVDSKMSGDVYKCPELEITDIAVAE